MCLFLFQSASLNFTIYTPLVLQNKIDIICISPTIPNMGYTMFTKFANPNRDIGIADKHIIILTVLYVLLFFIFAKKL